MPSLKMAVGVALALTDACAGLRKSKQKMDSSSEVTLVANVPVYNYDQRLQQQTSSGAYEWVLFLQKGALIEKICSKIKCKSRGHSDGVPFVSVGATDGEFRGLLKAFSDDVSFAEPDVEVYVPEVIKQPRAGVQDTMWHLDRVGRQRAAFKGRGTHIYVMDTGVRSTHQDFGGRAIPTLDTLAGGGTPVECNGDAACGTDYHGHGTHVAGTAGGTNYGVAPESTLYVMKVCCGSGTNVLGGMDWIVANGRLPAIMTVSLAAQGRSESSRQAVDRVVNAGVVVTVGAANDNVDTCTMTYGFIPSAISVGATDSNDQRARFSNFGPCNDIYAPGVSIFSAWNDADDGVRTISGTSMATPMAAGAAALLLEQDPTRSPAKVLEKMLEMSIKGVISDLQAGDPDMLLSVA